MLKFKLFNSGAMSPGYLWGLFLFLVSSIKQTKCCGVMVIVVGIGHGDTSSNPGLIAFHIALIPLGKV